MDYKINNQSGNQVFESLRSFYQLYVSIFACRSPSLPPTYLYPQHPKTCVYSHKPAGYFQLKSSPNPKHNHFPKNLQTPITFPTKAPDSRVLCLSKVQSGACGCRSWGLCLLVQDFGLLLWSRHCLRRWIGDPRKR